MKLTVGKSNKGEEVRAFEALLKGAFHHAQIFLALWGSTTGDFFFFFRNKKKPF